MPMFENDVALAEFNRLVGDDEELRQRCLDAAARAVIARPIVEDEESPLAMRDHIWTEAAIEVAREDSDAAI